MGGVAEIWMFHTGRSRLNRRRVEGGVRPETCWLPLLCFVLEHTEVGPILVDTGLGTRAIELRQRRLGRLVARAFGVSLGAGMDCRSRLTECGISPADVSMGVLTHLHFDHTGGIRDLPDTRFHVSRREWEYATAQRGPAGLLKGFLNTDYSGADNIESFEYTAVSGYEPFGAAHDLLGDESVVLLPTPGHTPGHTSLLVRTTGGRRVLLTGDAAFTRNQVTDTVPLGRMPRRIAADLEDAAASLETLRTFVGRHDDVFVLASHDPEQGDDVAEQPARLFHA